MIRASGRAPFVNQRCSSATLRLEQGQNLATLRELAEAGNLLPAIDRTYPLSAAADALRYLEAEHARAKVILTV